MDKPNRLYRNRYLNKNVMPIPGRVGQERLRRNYNTSICRYYNSGQTKVSPVIGSLSSTESIKTFNTKDVLIILTFTAAFSFLGGMAYGIYRSEKQ